MLTAIFIIANLLFAARELDVILRSRTSIETKEPDPSLPSLSIVVPARNEADRIERCVRSLLASRHPEFEVIVVDDQSTDATRAILDRIAENESRLRVVAGEPIPLGWIGKSWALTQGGRLARGTWLLFTDADTVHDGVAAASAQRYAIERRYDVLSLLTDQETVGWSERLLLPTILFVILLGVGALDDVNDPRKRDTAIFNGQYVLATREAYDAIGGHAAVRAEIAEDLELARLFKRDGRFRTFLAGSNALVRTRMYRSFADLWRGFVKNFALGARGHAARAVAGVTLIACVSPLSPLMLIVLIANAAWWLAVAIALAMGAVLAAAEFAMRTMRFRPGSGLAVPLGLAMTLAIFATSLVAWHGGSGVVWRGRRYSAGVFDQTP
ncbi:MAG TPA: glycosyltransferase [Candidatus Cybelea sp.]|nr:glycosyltransferase [Candidatus Cybelea sp.]